MQIYQVLWRRSNLISEHEVIARLTTGSKSADLGIIAKESIFVTDFDHQQRSGVFFLEFQHLCGELGEYLINPAWILDTLDVPAALEGYMFFH